MLTKEENRYEDVPKKTIKVFQKKYERAHKMWARFLYLNDQITPRQLEDDLVDRKAFEEYKKRVKLLWLAYYFNNTGVKEFFESEMRALIVGCYVDAVAVRYIKAYFCPRISTIINDLGYEFALKYTRTTPKQLREIRKAISNLRLY